jgi:hypothetical protein
VFRNNPYKLLHPQLKVLTLYWQADSVFSGISTFGRLPYEPCLGNANVQYDIAFLGVYCLDRIR